MFKKLLFLLSLTASLISEEDVARKVQNLLLIGHYEEALTFAKSVPSSQFVDELVIKALAACQKEYELIEAWVKYHEKYHENDRLLEEVCWGILRKGSTSTQLPVKLISVLGAAICQDVYALDIIKEGLRSSNVAIRSIAVELASFYGDHSLKEEIKRLFFEEMVWEVREGVYAAIAKLQIEELLPALVKKVEHTKISSEEKRALVSTIASLKVKAEKKELEFLISSNRAEQMLLAAKLVLEAPKEDQKELLLKLLNSSNREVKRAALESYGQARLSVTDEIRKISASNDYYLAIPASWVILLEEKESFDLLKWLESENPKARELAIGAVMQAGSYGVPLAKKIIETSKDPYILANAAIALLQQRVEIEKACEILYTFLNEEKELLMWEEEKTFSCIQKSSLRHNPLIPNFPEAMNQTVRLEILNLLAIVEYPKAQESLRTFLKLKRCAIVGIAAEVLLGEGDETALSHVEELLKDGDKQIRLSAALLLAVWGHSQTAVPILLEAYPHVQREEKIKILEALMQIGDRSTIPFLLERLKEPSQTMRIVAAAVIIQILNS